MPLFPWLLPVCLSTSKSKELNLTKFVAVFRSQMDGFLYGIIVTTSFGQGRPNLAQFVCLQTIFTVFVGKPWCRGLGRNIPTLKGNV